VLGVYEGHTLARLAIANYAAYSKGGSYELLGGFRQGEPPCIVDFYEYALFAEWLLETDCGPENNFCGGADLNY